MERIKRFCPRFFATLLANLNRNFDLLSVLTKLFDELNTERRVIFFKCGGGVGGCDDDDAGGGGGGGLFEFGLFFAEFTAFVLVLSGTCCERRLLYSLDDDDDDGL